MRPSQNVAVAALAMLAILQTVMLAALMTETPPHPPLAVAPFALGPFLGASIGLAVAAALLNGWTTTTGRLLTALAATAALASYGPQKWFDPAIAQIWPAVLSGQVAAVALLVGCAASLRQRAAPDAQH